MSKVLMARTAIASCVLTAWTGMMFQAEAQPENPVPYTKESIGRGRTWYMQNCPLCHGDDGKSLASAIADATDLTTPERWKYGTSDAALFSTIKNGAGDNMPGFASDLKDQQIWELLNFIRNIGPEAKRPPLRQP